MAAGAGIVKDGTFLTEDEQRTVCVSQTLPQGMQGLMEWHLSHFELVRELYRGKTSVLHEATHLPSGLPVALKLYRKKRLTHLNRYQVEREIRLQARLSHPHIVALHAAFEDDSNVYLAQEYADGGDLFEALKASPHGRFSEQKAVAEILAPFLDAVVFLHSQGIIHRDIKPENILLTSSTGIKLADFGLSIDMHQERPVTRAGTLDYMAPEVLLCPDKKRPEENKDQSLLAYNTQVDAWAIGILAYELVAGRPPFEQESRSATYEHIMYRDPKYPQHISEGARSFIGMALNKTASQRATVQDLASHPWILRHKQQAETTLPSTQAPITMAAPAADAAAASASPQYAESVQALDGAGNAASSSRTDSSSDASSTSAARALAASGMAQCTDSTCSGNDMRSSSSGSAAASTSAVALLAASRSAPPAAMQHAVEASSSAAGHVGAPLATPQQHVHAPVSPRRHVQHKSGLPFAHAQQQLDRAASPAAAASGAPGTSSPGRLHSFAAVGKAVVAAARLRIRNNGHLHEAFYPSDPHRRSSVSNVRWDDYIETSGPQSSAHTPVTGVSRSVSYMPSPAGSTADLTGLLGAGQRLDFATAFATANWHQLLPAADNRSELLDSAGLDDWIAPARLPRSTLRSMGLSGMASLSSEVQQNPHQQQQQQHQQEACSCPGDTAAELSGLPLLGYSTSPRCSCSSAAGMSPLRRMSEAAAAPASKSADGASSPLHRLGSFPLAEATGAALVPSNSARHRGDALSVSEPAPLLHHGSGCSSSSSLGGHGGSTIRARVRKSSHDGGSHGLRTLMTQSGAALDCILDEAEEQRPMRHSNSVLVSIPSSPTAGPASPAAASPKRCLGSVSAPGIADGAAASSGPGCLHQSASGNKRVMWADTSSAASPAGSLSRSWAGIMTDGMAAEDAAASSGAGPGGLASTLYTLEPAVPSSSDKVLKTQSLPSNLSGSSSSSAATGVALRRSLHGSFGSYATLNNSSRLQVAGSVTAGSSGAAPAPAAHADAVSNGIAAAADSSNDASTSRSSSDSAHGDASGEHPSNMQASLQRSSEAPSSGHSTTLAKKHSAVQASSAKRAPSSSVHSPAAHPPARAPPKKRPSLNGPPVGVLSDNSMLVAPRSKSLTASLGGTSVQAREALIWELQQQHLKQQRQQQRQQQQLAAKHADASGHAIAAAPAATKARGSETTPSCARPRSATSKSAAKGAGSAYASGAGTTGKGACLPGQLQPGAHRRTSNAAQ